MMAASVFLARIGRQPLSAWFVRGLATKKPPIDLREEDLDESFVKGSGKGGQKINKVRNNVFLKHRPTGLFVQCQKTRSLDDNRRVARKLLAAKLDDHFNGAQSVRSLKILKLQKKKAKKKAKSRQKHHAGSKDGAAPDDEDDSEDSENEDDEDDSDDSDDEDDEDDSAQDKATASTQRETQ
ncbi:hypothetical protein SDRG_10921 [Saprolegnia diclina VS20]|uniref:Prokaryotic-type class I peptide chain release factors domain-containing protein n=1 Tax=Saprolegnia diclina (strain VS20) TaxID=1156394 RepID=T0Q0E0_SAPDV|nr:hypothetical protein SDRG_10921 [Saprolegnia diclina VS20]EQC31319.1 hypothetical protein SDRG_10921 [Saprolegnia diclina VS20]|eukprot:XP_008615160.1 hypothetical protein SDRG_10921 [Saprolegnia diclina VS20]